MLRSWDPSPSPPSIRNLDSNKTEWIVLHCAITNIFNYACTLLQKWRWKVVLWAESSQYKFRSTIRQHHVLIIFWSITLFPRHWCGFNSSLPPWYSFKSRSREHIGSRFQFARLYVHVVHTCLYLPELWCWTLAVLLNMIRLKRCCNQSSPSSTVWQPMPDSFRME